MKQSIIPFVALALTLASCGTSLNDQRNKVQKAGYASQATMVGEDGFWYFNADSLFYFDAKTKQSECKIHRGEMIEWYDLNFGFDENNNLFAKMVTYDFDAPVLFDNVWQACDEMSDTDCDGATVAFGSKGIRFSTSEPDLDIPHWFLYSSSHPGRIYHLGEDITIPEVMPEGAAVSSPHPGRVYLLDEGGTSDKSGEMTIVYEGILFPFVFFEDKDLRQAFYGNYGRMAEFSWKITIDYEGNIVRTSDSVELTHLGIRVPVSHLATEEFEADLYPYAEQIKEQDFQYRVTETASHACDLNALNDLFRNYPVAEAEVVGTQQTVICRITESSVCWSCDDLESRIFEMETGDHRFNAVAVSNDPNFLQLHLPATVLFQGTVSARSGYNDLRFENCKFVAVANK